MKLLPKYYRTIGFAIHGIAFGLLCVATECNLLGQDPAPAPAPAPTQEEQPAEKPTTDTKPAQEAKPAQETQPAGEAKPAANQDDELDMFDDFFGKKPKEPKAKPKEKDKEENQEAAEVVERVMVDVAVPVPAIRMAPALRVAPGAMPAVAEGAENPDDWDLDPRLSRLMRVLKLERALLRRVCTLTPEQVKTLDTWDGKWLNQRLESDQGKKLARNLSVVPMGFPDVPGNKFREVLTKLIEPDLKTVLSEEQWTAYQTEVEARVAFEKQTEVDATIAILDHHLMLSSQQREEVEKVVLKMNSLPQEPLNYLRYGQYIPNMSFTPVLKHLNKYQRKIFQGLQQVQFGSSSEEESEIIED